MYCTFRIVIFLVFALLAMPAHAAGKLDALFNQESGSGSHTTASSASSSPRQGRASLESLMQGEMQQEAENRRRLEEEARQRQIAEEERRQRIAEQNAREERRQLRRERAEQARRQNANNQLMNAFMGVMNAKAAQQQAQRDAEQAAIIGRGRAASESLGRSSSSGGVPYSYGTNPNRQGVDWDTGKPYVGMTKEERNSIGKGPTARSGATR